MLAPRSVRLHEETERQLAALEASRPALHAEASGAANAQLDAVFASLQAHSTSLSYCYCCS